MKIIMCQSEEKMTKDKEQTKSNLKKGKAAPVSGSRMRTQSTEELSAEVSKLAMSSEFHKRVQERMKNHFWGEHLKSSSSIAKLIAKRKREKKINRGIVIPGKPVSVNHMYRNGISRNGKRARFLTDEGKGFKQRVAVSYLQRYGRKAPTEDPCLILAVYRWSDRRRRDVTNYDKALLDALAGCFFLDDSQIIAFTGIKFNGVNVENTEVLIYDIGEYDEFTADIGELCRKCLALTIEALIFEELIRKKGAYE